MGEGPNLTPPTSCTLHSWLPIAFLPFYMAFYFKPFVNLGTVHFTSGGGGGGGLLGFEGGGGHEKTYGLKGGHWKIPSNFAVTAFVITQTAFQNVKNQCSWHSESSDFPGEACPWTPTLFDKTRTILIISILYHLVHQLFSRWFKATIFHVITYLYITNSHVYLLQI